MKERRLVIEHKHWGRQSHASWTCLKVKERANTYFTFQGLFSTIWTLKSNSQFILQIIVGKSGA